MAKHQTYYYEDGNTVRKLEKSLPTRETYQEELRLAEQRHIKERKREHKLVLHLNRVYTVYFALGLFIGSGRAP